MEEKAAQAHNQISCIGDEEDLVMAVAYAIADAFVC